MAETVEAEEVEDTEEVEETRDQQLRGMTPEQQAQHFGCAIVEW
jgi:hypothetical protein